MTLTENPPLELVSGDPSFSNGKQKGDQEGRGRVCTRAQQGCLSCGYT